MFRKTYIGFCGVVLAAFLLGGCGNQPPRETDSAAKAEQKLRIAVLPRDRAAYPWKSVHAGAEKAAHELGDVEVLWQLPAKDHAARTQADLLHNLLQQGVDGVLVAPAGGQTLVPALKAAADRSIPVVVMGTELPEQVAEAFLVMGHFEGGRLCARRLAELLGGKGRVLMLKQADEGETTHKREAGFLDGLQEYGPGLEIIISSQEAGETVEQAFAASQQLLERNAALDGVFCTSQNATQGMLLALRQAGRVGQVKLVGFDVNQTLLTGLQKGEVHGLALLDPVAMGYLGVKTIHAAIYHEAFDRRIEVGVTLVHKENMNDPEVQALLNPAISQWPQE